MIQYNLSASEKSKSSINSAEEIKISPASKNSPVCAISLAKFFESDTIFFIILFLSLGSLAFFSFDSKFLNLSKNSVYSTNSSSSIILVSPLKIEA
jgi:hypothetical protein